MICSQNNHNVFLSIPSTDCIQEVNRKNNLRLCFDPSASGIPPHFFYLNRSAKKHVVQPPPIQVMDYNRHELTVYVQENALHEFSILLWREYRHYITERKLRFEMKRLQPKHPMRRLILSKVRANKMSKASHLELHNIQLPFVVYVQRLARGSTTICYYFEPAFKAQRAALAIFDPDHVNYR